MELFAKSYSSQFRCRVVATVLFCSGFLLCGSVSAQEGFQASAGVHEQIEAALKALPKTQGVGEVAVSPDGKWLAWVGLGKQEPQILVASIESSGRLGKGRAVEAVAGQECREGVPVWAPDSKHLAFFARCEKHAQANLYLAEVGAKGAARRLTELHGNVDAPAFSPDGSRIGFLYVEGATRPPGAVAAMKAPSGVIGEDGIEIQRVAVARVDASKPSAPEQISPLSLHVYEFNWALDSKALAYVAAAPPGENNWWVAKLYTQTLAVDGTLGAPRAILAPSEVAGPLHGLQIAVPRWSPDGQSIAFIGGLMSDQGSTGGDVWLVPSTGGEPRNLTADNPTTSEWFDWVDDQHIDVSELAGGDAQLVRLHVTRAAGGDSAATENLHVSRPGTPFYSMAATVGDGRMSMSLSATRDHSAYFFHASSFDHAPEVYEVQTSGAGGKAPPARGLSSLMQLTHLNDSARPAWGKAESLSWKNEGFDVQGWLLWPANYDPSKRYPMIVAVHGGPSAAMLSRWGMGGSLSTTMFSAMGYFVLAPNPRGSYGQGERFTQANRKDFGYGDLRDILAGVDAVLAKYPVDANRVGIEGWSYGGFMSMFAVTQTGRFRASVAGAGISNWQSYYGENSIDQWMLPFFGGSVYDDPAVYAKSSAINFIHQAHTPTLVIVGDRDGECPAPQSYEFWHALRDQHVPSQLVVYPNEGHGFANAAHQRDVLERAMEWFAHFMPAN